MTLKYGILSQSTAVFLQSVENVVNTRSSMGKKKYRDIPWNRYNLEKYRDINFWSYRPALLWCTALVRSVHCIEQQRSVLIVVSSNWTKLFVLQ